MRSVKLNKQNILQLKLLDDQSRQEVLTVDGYPGLRVRVGRKHGCFTHTFCVEKRVSGRLQKRTLGVIAEFESVQAVKRAYASVIGAWAIGQDLSNPPIGQKHRITPNRKATFGDLISTYLQWQQVTGKKSARTIANVINNHIRGKETRNEIWLSNLSDVDNEIISDFLSHLRDSATPHIADHVRQIIKAAYNKASNSFSEDIELKEKWKALGVRTPIKVQSKKITGSDTVKSNSLSLAQLKALIDCIDQLGQKDQQGQFKRKAFLLFHIYTGGQRATQLQDLTASTIIERDGQFFLQAAKHQKKTGASDIKKPHLLPITPWIRQCIEEMGTPMEPDELRKLKVWEAADTSNRHYVWNIIDGDNLRAPDITTLPKLYNKWVQPLLNETKLLEPTDRVQPNWIRKSVETLMRQQFDTRPDHLGWLQDHGIGGVQNKHYNQYDYLDQKRDLLIKWFQLCRTDP